MNCEEVKAHLIEYLDKTLDTPTTTRVATHLISCAPCGAEAGALGDCMHQVAALPTVDPPLGFAGRVMAHVREIEAKPTVWERLFLLPNNWNKFNLKLPLQAAALVMVGIMGIMLYRSNDQLKRPEPKNTTLATAVESGNANNKSIPANTRQTDKKQEPALEAPVALTKRAEQAPAMKPLSSLSSEQSSSAKSETEARLAETKLSRRAPIQVQEASNPGEVGRFSGGAGFAPAMPLGGLRQAAPRSGTMALDRAIPLGERVADYEFVVRRRPPQRRDLLADGMSTDSAAKSVDADSAARPAAPAPGAPKIESIAEIRFYNVAPEHFEYFKKELASEAIVEAESKPAAMEKEKELARFDRQLLIKVTILPPALPEPNAPPR